ILSVVNQAWKIDTGQPSSCARFGQQPYFAEASQGILPRDLRGCQSCEALGATGWWGKKDSNLRSHKTADLQSAPFATRDTPPLNSIATHPPKWRRQGHG